MSIPLLSPEIAVDQALRYAASVVLQRRAILADRLARGAELANAYEQWLEALFLSYICEKETGERLPFSDMQHDFWRWVWAIQRGQRPRPFVAIWPRGAGKSTSAELACVALGARQMRRYIWYVCETQDQADEHVLNIGSMLESPGIETAYPELGNKGITEHGVMRGWGRKRFHTASGLTIDAIGLNKAARGRKIDEDRPDLIILDDIDSELDGPAQIARKETMLTRKVLAAGAPDVAILAIQNIVHATSVFAGLARPLAQGGADMLADRIISGPHPAIKDMTYERAADGTVKITGGTPTWAGQDIVRCEAIIRNEGLIPFLIERQHETDVRLGGMYDDIDFAAIRIPRHQVPVLRKIVVALDPAVTARDKSDSQGIIVDGVDDAKIVYRLWCWEGIMSPEAAVKLAILKAVEYRASEVIIETDQGGDLWRSTYATIWKTLVDDGEVPLIPGPGPDDPPRLPACPTFMAEKAGEGHGPKAHRQSLVHTHYGDRKVRHVTGTHQVLERALKRFPVMKPFDLADAGYWSVRRLIQGGQYFA